MRKSPVELARKASETIDFSDEKEVQKFVGFGFGTLGENYIGIRRWPEDQMMFYGSNSLTITPKGLLTPREHQYGLHVIYSGTPHHTRHLFGYWHINDVDEAYIRVPPTEPGGEATLVIVMRYPRPGERDMFAYYCENCLTLVQCYVYDSGNLDQGFIGVLQFEDHVVKTFNSDPALRTCKECGTVHPLAYRFWEPHNTPDEEEARSLW
ncbi:MAG: hypothetical protein JOZ46_12065 [Candidatus Dormibacteraeota bacterium]|nr:hypothetical protein [Candidatus Dormibacteraeota bacterium]MBV9526536.1 hypothetical protein [Candidatus Dormibacteraeota bacterium]